MLSERTLGALFLAMVAGLFSFDAVGGVSTTLTPEFEWSPFHNDLFPLGQAGYQLCVYDSAVVVYDTGFIADTQGNTHRYSPGAYTGTDPVAGSTRVSQALAWSKPYHCTVRYRDTAGHWTDWSSSASGAHLDLFTTQASTVLVDLGDAVAGDQASFAVPVNVRVPGSWPVNGFAFDVVFDANLMEFDSCQTSRTLTSAMVVNTVVVSPGLLHVATAGGNPISQSGELLRLVFRSRGAGWQSASCALANLDAGLMGYPSSPGTVDWYKSGDPNRDGRVTPGDAQRAMESYLGSFVLGALETLAADLDADQQVTPGDAQDIFAMYLTPANKTGLPAEPPATVVAGRGAARSLALSRASARPGQRATVAAHVAGAERLAAFGFDVRFDPARLRLVDAVRQGTASERWSLLSSRLLAPGCVRVGGTAGTGAPLDGEGSVVLIRFAVADDAPVGTTALFPDKPTDGLSGCALSAGAVEVVAQPSHHPEPPPSGGNPVVDAQNLGFFVLDDFGAVHTGGAAQRVDLSGGPYFGWNIARAMALIQGPAALNSSRLGVAVVDGFGALHTYSAVRPPQAFYFYPEPGDCAVDVEVCRPANGDPATYGFFVLDRHGRLWAGGSADPMVAAEGSVQPPLDGVACRAIDLVLADDAGRSGWIMDNLGGVHAFGSAPEVAFGVGIQNDWIRLLRVDDQFVRVDASGGMEWSGAPRDDWRLPVVDGGLLVDVEVEAGLGLVGLDRYGALYASGTAILPPQGQGPAYFGMEAARDLAMAAIPAAPEARYDPAAQAPAAASYNPLNYAYSLKTGMEMQRIDGAVVARLAAGGGLPTDLGDFATTAFGSNGVSLATDSWGEAYRLFTSGKGYYLVSAGPDRTLETTDDLWIGHVDE